MRCADILYADYLCIRLSVLYPERSSWLYSYRRRTWNTKPKFNLTLSVLNEQITSKPDVYTGCVSRPSWCLSVCCFSCFLRRTQTRICRCLHIYAAERGRNTKGCFNQSHNYCDDINVSFRPGNKQSIILNKSILSRGNMPISDSVCP